MSSENRDDTYFSDYESEPIGGGNPYYRCVHCKRSDPEINGRLEGHSKGCTYRTKKEAEKQPKGAVWLIQKILPGDA